MTSAFRPTRQAPGVHHRFVGEMVVTALNDGVLDASFDWLTHLDPAEPPALHAASFRAVPPRITVNAFLLHVGERLVLVDGGCGGGMGPALGRLAENFAVLGIAPGSIDTVLLTHLHPDHVGAWVDDAGKAWLPNAGASIVHADELSPFWQDDAACWRRRPMSIVRSLCSARSVLEACSREWCVKLWRARCCRA